ncbi:MAG: hypothetical protein E4G91_01130 [Candidatus Zixiibacteriota bacterium]|nr:MAG: hypothetical protein E4G91_01130 [candidate division Zixibacteria bacterium]
MHQRFKLLILFLFAAVCATGLHVASATRIGAQAQRVANESQQLQNVSIHTATNRLMVNQAGQAGAGTPGSSFSYFIDTTEDFITDASLIMGNSSQNLSWRIFENGQGDPTPTNNFGWLYALSNITVDSTTFPSYRIASGKGTNRDSTIGFDVDWYAAKHIDSADFYVGHFEIYKGSNNPSGTVTDLTIAFACDWDVPSDTSSDNTIGIDAARQMISLQGQYSSDRQKGFAATAAYREDGVPITGGFGWGNQQQVYNLGGYSVDSVWKYMEAIPAPPNNYNSTWLDSVGDMSIVMVVAKNYTVTPTSRLKFDVVLAAKRAEMNPVGLAGLNTAVDKARKFICAHVAAGSELCDICTSCGDTNGDGVIDISDAVALIGYIFFFPFPIIPGDCNYPMGMGDANGDGGVDISDAVYLIAYIFSGGGAPHCQGK